MLVLGKSKPEADADIQVKKAFRYVHITRITYPIYLRLFIRS